jgi:hypothetical protein
MPSIKNNNFHIAYDPRFTLSDSIIFPLKQILYNNRVLYHTIGETNNQVKN